MLGYNGSRDQAAFKRAAHSAQLVLLDMSAVLCVTAYESTRLLPF